MTPEQITELIRQTLWIALEIGAPFLLLALIIGVLISFLQSMTQMQEMTLTFVPKMLLISTALALFFPWMIKILTKFTQNLLICQWEKLITATHYVQ